MLFTGTLRFNLTPFGEHSDAECWAALRRAHLAGVAEASPLGLDLVLREGGAPLSAGQKQLVALARALLRHSKARPGRPAGRGCRAGRGRRAPRSALKGARAVGLGRGVALLSAWLLVLNSLRAGPRVQGWLGPEVSSGAPACRGAGAADFAGARAAAHGQGRVRVRLVPEPGQQPG